MPTIALLVFRSIYAIRFSGARRTVAYFFCSRHSSKDRVSKSRLSRPATRSTVRYPTPNDVIFWKKCVPWLGSTWNPGMEYSTMTFASEMSLQMTGMPRFGSDEPQRPGPIRI